MEPATPPNRLAVAVKRFRIRGSFDLLGGIFRFY
jgi:hypothetical protein